MNYPEELVKPMRRELTSVGFQELRTAAQVDLALSEKNRSVLVVVNSICGCAAGNARPAVKAALKHTTVPDKLATVFAGQDIEATARVREYAEGYPPSSPSMALFKNGKIVYMLERQRIEGRDPADIVADLRQAFETFLK
jgi:putative YphP/YqiW family bacilliredoxin